jgi:acetamidase/formamidase
MKREYVQWLRGDAIKEAVDIYFHIDPKDVKELTWPAYHSWGFDGAALFLPLLSSIL